LVDCAGNKYNCDGCNGGIEEGGMDYAAAKGIELESTYPYTAQDGTCKYSATKTVFRN